MFGCRDDHMHNAALRAHINVTMNRSKQAHRQWIVIDILVCTARSTIPCRVKKLKEANKYRTRRHELTFPCSFPFHSIFSAGFSTPINLEWPYLNTNWTIINRLEAERCSENSRLFWVCKCAMLRFIYALACVVVRCVCAPLCIVAKEINGTVPIYIYCECIKWACARTKAKWCVEWWARCICDRKGKLDVRLTFSWAINMRMWRSVGMLFNFTLVPELPVQKNKMLKNQAIWIKFFFSYWEE